MRVQSSKLLQVLGPGLLVAATGVGAGDLATAGFAGSKLGLIVLWAVIVGAAMKFVLNEGLARWQLATDTTLLEGVSRHIGRWAILVFLIYLLPFTFVVGGALIAATGVATHAIVGWPADPETATLLWGGIGSAVATLLVLLGSFTLFERIMAAGIVVMFVAVCLTALLLGPDWGAMAQGVVPSHPGDGESLDWTVALVGGVGGTVTVLCYGYWMRQAGRTGTGFLSTCRIDLLVAYSFTALFGIAMLVIASGIEIQGRGTGLLVALSKQLHAALGPVGAMIFLVGAWAAIVSSLLGVWQSIPLLFADATRSLWGLPPVPAERLGTTPIYRVFLLLLATVPMLQAGLGFASVQKAYAVLGAFFLPMLAIVLLILNGRRALVGAQNNRPWTVVLLLCVLAFFAWVAMEKVGMSW
ncbi:MAG: Nramp family divalent metal transporter [Phycisphaerales bacterium]|nr:Nramp family divalent metal transporter [Phycisphaerales bacterium]